jgi:hypothetical protein
VRKKKNNKIIKKKLFTYLAKLQAKRPQRKIYIEGKA